jgi:eukaryotic-like serine/threonine-protein kinase
MGHPHCDVAALLTPLSDVAAREGASLAFAAKSNEVYIGERPALDLWVPGFDSYLYVDYFDSGGQVQHLFPNDRDRFNLRPWRNHFVLFKSPLWTVCGNIGRQLITMVAVSKSIFPARRPEIEDAPAYLASLGDAVKRIPQGKTAASLLFFDLREAPPWISRDQACPGG